MIVLLCFCLFSTTILASPIPEEVEESSTILSDDPSTEIIEPKPRQLLIAYLDPSAMSSPLRTKEEIINPDEEDPNSHVEVFNEDSEIMQPAENIIFRPLFSYKVAQAKKNNRIQQNNQRRITNEKEASRRSDAKKKAAVEQNTIKRRSDVYSYRPDEIPYVSYRPSPVPLYYYYEGRFYPYY